MAIINGTLRDDGGAVVNVMHPDFGAVGDGLTDDAGAIQAAQAHAASLGGGWVLCPRLHRLDDDLLFDDPSVGLMMAAGARLRPAEGRLARISAPLQADGPWIDLSLAGEVDFTRGWPGVARAEWWGARGDGVTDDTPALAAAALVLGRNGGTLLLPPGTYRTTADLAFAASVTLVFLPGAVLRPAVGTAVTVNGPVQAGSWRWMDTSAGGRVRLGPGTIGEAPAQWWGARADGTADATAAFAAAAEALEDAGGGVLLLSSGAYLVSDLVTLPPAVELRVLPGATVRLGAGAMLVLQGRVHAPDCRWIDGSPGGSIVFDLANAVVAPQWWGAVADGITDCAAAFTEAVGALYAAMSGTLRLPAGRYLLGSDVVMGPAGGLRVEPGAVLQPAEGVTVVVCMAFSALPTQWIDLTGGGRVTIARESGADVIPHWWGALGENIGNDGPALAQALESIAAAGGGRLYLPAGEYPVFEQVPVLGGNVRVEGAGDGTVLVAGSGAWAPGQHLLRAADGAANVSVAHLRMVGLGAASEGPGGVHAGEGTRGVWVERCTFEDFGAAAATDHSGSAGGGVRDSTYRKGMLGAVLSGIAGSRDTSISGCELEDVAVAIDVRYGSGSIVASNVVRYTGDFAPGEAEAVGIRVLGQAGTRVMGNEIDSGGYGQATGQQIAAGIRLGNNDAAAAEPQNGFPTRVLVSGNAVRGAACVAIELVGAGSCDIVHNQVQTGPGEAGIDDGVLLGFNAEVDPVVFTTRTVVSGNRVEVSPCGCGMPIVEMFGGDPQGNAIVDNGWLSGQPDAPTVYVTCGSDVTVRDNLGYRMSAAGTATVGAADTSVAVTVAMDTSLSAGNILLTPLSSLGAAARFWVQAVDEFYQTFEIALDAAPGGTGAEFAWRVVP